MSSMVDFNQIPSPCYVVEEQLLRNNLELIQNVGKRAGVEIILAFKAFSFFPLFPIIREYINTATASSLFEAKLCFDEMKNRAHTYSPIYNANQFAEILKYSSHITFNSLSQAERFLPQLLAAGNVSAGLRINPEYSDVEVDLYNPCSPGSRLGVVASLLQNGLPKGIEGLHFHTLCESRSHNLEATLLKIEEKFGAILSQVKWINMGGGHLMTHQDYDENHLVEVLLAFKARHPHLSIVMEPGSAFAWQTGFLLSRVEDIVENKGITTAMLDVSFTCHMPDCLEMPYKPVVRGAHQEPVSGKPTYRLGGCSCLAGDFLGSWSFDEPLKIGDKLIFEDMIHYTIVKTTMFNGVAHPAIGILDTNNQFKLLREFGYNDYKSRVG